MKIRECIAHRHTWGWHRLGVLSAELADVSVELTLCDCEYLTFAITEVTAPATAREIALDNSPSLLIIQVIQFTLTLLCFAYGA